jgi:hypothetical protein
MFGQLVFFEQMAKSKIVTPWRATARGGADRQSCGAGECRTGLLSSPGCSIRTIAARISGVASFVLEQQTTCHFRRHGICHRRYQLTPIEDHFHFGKELRLAGASRADILSKVLLFRGTIVSGN